MKKSIKVSAWLGLLVIILNVTVFVSCTKEKALAPKPTPVASAGTDTIITSPQDSIELNGSATVNMGKIISYEWTQTAGPFQAILVNNNNPSTLARNMLIPGLYEFELKVTADDGLFAFGKVHVNILAISSQGPLGDPSGGYWDY